LIIVYFVVLGITGRGAFFGVDVRNIQQHDKQGDDCRAQRQCVFQFH